MRRPVLIGCVAVVVLLVGVAVAQTGRSCPGAISLDDCYFSIEDVEYMTRVESGNVKVTESSPDKFHFALVTLRIEKPEGRALKVAAADLTLHYSRRGEEYDVAACDALSSFTVSRSEDRPLRATCECIGCPGWLKQETGSASRGASAVYIDALFAKVERDVDRLWICVAQPATSRQTDGW